jgi:hypothetical protein
VRASPGSVRLDDRCCDHRTLVHRNRGVSVISRCPRRLRLLCAQVIRVRVRLAGSDDVPEERPDLYPVLWPAERISTSITVRPTTIGNTISVPYAIGSRAQSGYPAYREGKDPHVLRLTDVIIDCPDTMTLASFYSEVTGRPVMGQQRENGPVSSSQSASWLLHRPQRLRLSGLHRPRRPPLLPVPPGPTRDESPDLLAAHGRCSFGVAGGAIRRRRRDSIRRA